MRTVNVSGSTSMRGSASFSGMSALRQPAGVGDRAPAGGARPAGRPARRRAPPARRSATDVAAAGTAVRAEHRPRQHRLRRGDRRVRVAHRGPGDHPALDHERAAARRRTPGPTAPGRRACPARPSRPRRRGRARPPGRSCTSRRSGGPAGCRPARRRAARPGAPSSTCAVCQVRRTTSPTRPIACESEPIIEIAPRSCSRSSAAIVDGRMRLSANARSSGTVGLRWWQTMSMSRCSSSGVARCAAGSGSSTTAARSAAPATVMMSGACPPPAPSVWYAWIAPPGDRARACPRRSRPRSACRCGSPPARRTRRPPAGRRRSRPASCPSPRAA